MSDLLSFLLSGAAAAGDDDGHCFGLSAAADGGGGILVVPDGHTDQQPQDEEGLKGMDEVEERKQEDFRGGGEGKGACDYVLSGGGGGEELLNHGGNQDADVPPRTTNCDYSVGRPVGIGLSMIKNWLRSQQEPAEPAMPPTAAATGGDERSVSAGGGAWALDAQSRAIQAVQRKPIVTAAQRTSMYRGVTRHRWTGRYEAHLWDNSYIREGQSRKGRQVYLGGYDKEERAATAYDLAALKYWGTSIPTNFPINTYEKELKEMSHMSRLEYVASLRRKSSGFSRGASKYRGVTRHHRQERWQARIGRVAGNKDLYLGTFSTQEEAAEAYDIAAIKFRGQRAITNFELSHYDVKGILESRTLPIAGNSASKRIKELLDQAGAHAIGRPRDTGLTITDGGVGAYSTVTHHYGHLDGWPSMAYQPAPQPLAVQYPCGQPRAWCNPVQDASLYELQQWQMGGNAHNYVQPPAVQGFKDKGPSSGGFMYSGGVGYSGYQAQMPAKAVRQNEGFQAAAGANVDGGMVAAGSDPYRGWGVYFAENAMCRDNVYGQSWAPSSSSA